MTRFVGEPSPEKKLSTQRASLESLARRPVPASAAGGGSGSGYPSIIELPIFPRKGSGNFDSAAWTYTIDAAAPGGGYAENTADGAEQSWLVNLGPEDSAWKILVVAAKGTDYGKLDVMVASAPPDSFWTPDTAYPSDTTSITYVLLENLDFYAAAPAAYPNTPNAQVFKVNGADGDVGTSFTAGAGIYAGQQIWDGGPGMQRVKLQTNGQNGSSAGFRMRLSQVWIMRVDTGLVL